MTGEDFRGLALSLDGSVERTHMNHPDFRVNGRIFATLKADEGTGVVRLQPTEQARLVKEHPDVFSPASGAWGRQGWTMIALGRAGSRAVRSALLLAWQHAVEQPAKPRRPRR